MGRGEFKLPKERPLSWTWGNLLNLNSIKLFFVMVFVISAHACGEKKVIKEKLEVRDSNGPQITSERKYYMYYGGSTAQKINHLAKKDKLLFSEAEAIVLGNENKSLRKNLSFDIFCSTDSVRLEEDNPAFMYFTEGVPYDMFIYQTIESVNIKFNIIGRENLIWVGKLSRRKGQLDLSLDGLDAFTSGSLVAYECRVKINTLNQEYNSLILNGWNLDF